LTKPISHVIINCMTPTKIHAFLNEIHTEVEKIQNANEKTVIAKLLNFVETLASENKQMIEEIQQLKNEINRLKGEQGKPEFKGKKPKDGDISSEDERKKAEGKGQKGKNSTRNRDPKLPSIQIDREEVCSVNPTDLPEDAVFKGYEEVVIQELKIITDNVKYLREIYYSPSQNKTWRGDLPKDVAGKGEFGPGIRSLIPLMKSECKLSEPKILDFFRTFGIYISAAYLSTQGRPVRKVCSTMKKTRLSVRAWKVEGFSRPTIPAERSTGSVITFKSCVTTTTRPISQQNVKIG
jgi:hypothetical protein